MFFMIIEMRTLAPHCFINLKVSDIFNFRSSPMEDLGNDGVQEFMARVATPGVTSVTLNSKRD